MVNLCKYVCVKTTCMKRKYIKPEFILEICDLEESFAAGSGKLYPGGNVNDVPEVKNWISNDSDYDYNQGFSEEW